MNSGMNNVIVHVAYGFLAVAGALHFVIDVLSQKLRAVRAPGVETTLYYGLHSSYALSQVLLGVAALVVARTARELLGQWPFLALTAGAIAGWLAIGLLFIEYREPKLMLGIFAALFVAHVVTLPR